MSKDTKNKTEAASEESGAKKKRAAVIVIAVAVLAVAAAVAVPTVIRGRGEGGGAEAAKSSAQAELDALNEAHDALIAALADRLPGIVCWGDSLTQGPGGGRMSYPTALQNLINEAFCDRYDPLSTLSEEARQLAIESGKDYSLSIPVVNMGAGSDTTNTILGRNGAVPFVTTANFTVPAGTDSVPIRFASANGRAVNPLTWTNAGMETVTVGGIEGEITGSFGSYSFHRLTPGEQTVIDSGTIIHTSGSEPYREYLTVVFFGHNGGYTSIDDLLSQQMAIVEHQTKNNDRYIVIGMHMTGIDMDLNIRRQNQRMADAYGDKFIDLRRYMLTQAIYDAGLEPTEADLARIRAGYIPTPLLDTDQLHFSAIGYELIGQLVFDKMEELGYFEVIDNSEQ